MGGAFRGVAYSVEKTMTVPDFSDRAIAKREADRRRAEADERTPAVLLPPEAFSDLEATDRDFRRLCEPGTGTGRRAAAVHRRIMGSCAGWRKRPSASEFYDAVRARRPTEREQNIIRMWGREATYRELIEAWAQRAYTTVSSWRRCTSRRSTTVTESA